MKCSTAVNGRTLIERKKIGCSRLQPLTDRRIDPTYLAANLIDLQVESILLFVRGAANILVCSRLHLIFFLVWVFANCTIIYLKLVDQTKKI
jgi:hypothetical protein